MTQSDYVPESSSRDVDNRSSGCKDRKSKLTEQQSESTRGRAPGNAARKSRAKADSARSEQEDTPNQV